MATEEERKRKAAARQARYRDRRKAHDAGDHSECRAESCEAVRAATVDLDETSAPLPGDAGSDVTRDVTDTPKNPVSHRSPPADLGPRGLRLWDEMAGMKLGPAHVLLLERLCRKADRLERMDGQLEGRDWLHLVDVPQADGGVVEVRVDRVLSEMRQTEIALKLDVAELRNAGRATTAGGGVVPPGPVDTGEASDGGKRRGGLAAIKGGLDTTG